MKMSITMVAVMIAGSMLVLPPESVGQSLRTTTHVVNTAPLDSRTFTCPLPDRNRVLSCVQVSIPSGTNVCVTTIAGPRCTIGGCGTIPSDTGYRTTIVCGRVIPQARERYLGNGDDILHDGTVTLTNTTANCASGAFAVAALLATVC
jgi:hypothetical protein